MASVKAIATHSDLAWSGGLRKRRYRVTLTDNNLVDHEIVAMPVKVLAIDDGSDRAAVELQTQSDKEIRDAVKGAFAGVSPETVTPIWNTQQEFDRRVIGRMMLVQDVHAFHTAITFFQGIESRGGANAGQRATYLGIIRADYDLIAARFGDSQGAAFFITDSKNQVWDELPPVFE